MNKQSTKRKLPKFLFNMSTNLHHGGDDEDGGDDEEVCWTVCSDCHAQTPADMDVTILENRRYIQLCRPCYRKCEEQATGSIRAKRHGNG